MQPSLDNTSGATFIGYSLATVLYGIGCLQTFVYMTSKRARQDESWLSWFTALNFHVFFAVLMYYGLIRSQGTDAQKAEAVFMAQKFMSAAIGTAAFLILFIQLFFCWRVWILTRLMLAKQYRVALMLLMGSLAILGVVSAITETFYLKELAFSNANRKMIMFFEIQNSSATALDTILAIAMTLCLLNSKSGARRTDHVINLLVFFTMNTNLLTAIFQWIELILALTLSQTQIYSIFALMVPKLYFNSFLATLNSRDFMQSKLHESGSNQPVSISGMRFGPDHLIDGRTDSSGTADFEHELINKSISDGHEIEMGGRK